MNKVKVTKYTGFIAALVLYMLFFWFVMARNTSRGFLFDKYQEYGKVIFVGWLSTIGISLLGICIATIIGMILYIMEESGIPVIKELPVIHKNIMFGTPLVVIAIIAYYYIGNALGIDNKMFVGSITLGLYIGAYISDIYKGAIQSIHPNQWQTAQMFGFTKYQTYRYIIIPQVVVTILPGLAGQLALTVKGSALLAYMGTGEYFQKLNNVMAISFRYAEGFILMAIGYWIITIPLVRLVRYLEVKVQYREVSS